MRLGYLYSRYPVISQTFCDAEMLALERRGIELVIGSVYPPLTSLRHEYIARLRAPIHYAPPQEILKILERNAKTTGKWPRNLVEEHARKYGPGAKAELRARNALYFADFFTRANVHHVHVHFANRAAHTALFLKEISGIPFSVTAHGQDFMKDLGSDDLLREICAAAEFVAAETDYSRDLLRQRCPASPAKIHRVYNGIDLERFSMPRCDTARPAIAPYHVPQIVSVGRLVTFKGFEDLIDACAELQRRGADFICEIIGDGPLREMLQAKIERLDLSSRVRLLGSLSQNGVLETLQAADLFALASTTDAQGATDIFPTVILEAMPKIAYLIDRWPDHELPLLERELNEMKQRNVSIIPLVSEFNSGTRLNRQMQQIAPFLKFLPDAMVLEAEWRANPGLAQQLEEDRAQQSGRVPGAIFLRQARFALALRKLLQEQRVSHIHATSSGALVCALILKKLLDVTVSATIEPRTKLPRDWIQNALSECTGGRLSNQKLVEQFDASFVLDRTTFRSVPRKTLGLITQKTGMDLTTGSPFWQQWAEFLMRWRCEQRPQDR